MAADAELGVMLEPKNDLEDEVDDIEVGADVNGGAGRGRGGNTGTLLGAGAVARGAAAGAVLGILAAMLSQLRSVNETASGLLKTFNRLALPLIASIVDLIRPLIDFVNEGLAQFNIRDALNSFTSSIGATFSRVADSIITGFNNAVSSIPGVDIGQEGNQNTRGSRGGNVGGQAVGTSIAATNPAITGFSVLANQLDNLGTDTADLQDEDKKETGANILGQILEEYAP